MLFTWSPQEKWHIFIKSQKLHRRRFGEYYNTSFAFTYRKERKTYKFVMEDAIYKAYRDSQK
jgi:hypothetical protein